MKTYSIIGVVAITAVLSFLFSSKENINKINGVSLVAPQHEVIPEYFESITDLEANWVAVIPYAFSPENSEIVFDHPQQWRGEKKTGVCEQISSARIMGLQIMVKPHIWVRGQGWAGEFELDSEKEWQDWEQSYSRYILTYAEVADSLNVDMFCIGTEYRKAVVARPEFWKQLISQVREIYSGPITYAANWDNFHRVTFWAELDYIGIDAYFPLSEVIKPDIDDLNAGWTDHRDALRNVSRIYDKPILFTEFGYQSVEGAAGNHWEANTDIIDLGIQEIAYQSLFEVFWSEEWFAGGFLWKWHFKDARGGPQDSGFTPQGKPAARTIRNWYSRF